MHGMDERLRSGGCLVKKKNSSGCLIIKKKGDGSSSGQKRFLEPSKEKKNSYPVLSDSESSDEFIEEHYHSRVSSSHDKFRNGSVLHSNSFTEDNDFRWSSGGVTESERKRKHKVFDFDEYDRINTKKTRKDHNIHSRFRLPGNEAESSKYSMEDKRERSYFNGERQKFRMHSEEAIRLQGKNGVLKVMVNRNNKMDLPNRSYNLLPCDNGRRGSNFRDAINMSNGPSLYKDSRSPEKVHLIKKEKKLLKLQESKITKRTIGENNISLKLGSKGLPKSEGNALTSEKSQPPSGGGKTKRGTGTEKQLLRVKIRQMLVEAGWTIDYRPRKNRDYLDAVYINPSGTAYWSIIKAYDALQKQLEEDNIKVKQTGKTSGFAPLPEELLNKLTRQTRKKMEKELKMKRKYDDGHEKKAEEEESAEDTDDDKVVEKCRQFKKKHGKDSETNLYVSGDDSSDVLYKNSNADGTHGRKGHKIGRRTLLVRGSNKGVVNSETDDYIPYAGKRTLLSWLIDSETVHLSEKVQYVNRKRTKPMLEGWITRDGIHCGCCSKILSVSKFEIHAGSKLRQPFQNMFLDSGISLLQCQVDAWNKQEETERCGFYKVDTNGDDPNDDTCGLCGDGGDLICCDGCPSTFHQNCLGIKILPAGDWHCQTCTCKYCGVADDILVQANGSSSRQKPLICSLCEKKCHASCAELVNNTLDVDSNTESETSFCSQKCGELFDHLQKLVGKHELEGGFSWSLIHRSDLDTDTSQSSFPQKVENNSKLAVALSVLDECFLPVFDRRSGCNMIHNAVYNCGSNFSRLNYSGFYTAILEKGDEIIAAASLRIHGTQLAEMPFIGTRQIYRRQGMCRRLLNAIESVLRFLDVQKLVIPAIAEYTHTWAVIFGFSPLEESYKREMRSLSMLVFPGTDMLQKPLLEPETSNLNITISRDPTSLGDDVEINDTASDSNDEFGSTRSSSESRRLVIKEEESVPLLQLTDNIIAGSNSAAIDVLPNSKDPDSRNVNDTDFHVGADDSFSAESDADANIDQLDPGLSLLSTSVMEHKTHMKDNVLSQPVAADLHYETDSVPIKDVRGVEHEHELSIDSADLWLDLNPLNENNLLAAPRANS
ncbi:uncharacterized protein LOC124944126 [Impatiens glandulifera]|uniref:uncharacterized protein LOC124944126 n=1 Tax=Impatiens glandulifera TaxID=253017 RepID=UPI001FB11EEF|nr:uncharacterized protein LOC124944126 [Impatiens glandulifera]